MSDKVTGVYELQNLTAGRSYIGSSVDVWARINQHRKLLREGRHWNKWLQADWNTYGEAAFECSIIAEVPEDELTVLEQRHINDKWVNTYNAAKRACRLPRPTSESQAKRAATIRGKPWSALQRAALTGPDGRRKGHDTPRPPGWRANISASSKNGTPRRRAQTTSLNLFRHAARRAIVQKAGPEALRRGLYVRCGSMADAEALADWLRMNGAHVATIAVKPNESGVLRPVVGPW
jgi:hypothetical protein